jgi:hypothetical protein
VAGGASLDQTLLIVQPEFVTIHIAEVNFDPSQPAGKPLEYTVDLDPNEPGYPGIYRDVLVAMD